MRKKPKMNKAAKTNVVLVILLIVVAIYGYNQGWFANILGSKTTDTSVANDGAYPSDLKQTLTLNTKDSLSPTDLNANVSYYLFDANGAYEKSGTTVAGTASIDINYGQKYTVIAFLQSGNNSYAPVKQDFTADSEKSLKTLTLQVAPLSMASITSVRDPVDLNQNISNDAGSQVPFDIIYKVNTANEEIYNPVIVVDVNKTSTANNGVAITGLTAITCPARLSISTERQKYCFQDTTLKSKDGLRVLGATILFSSTKTPADQDNLIITILNSGMYTDPNFASTGISAFKEGAENPNDLSVLGASDSATYQLDLAG